MIPDFGSDGLLPPGIHSAETWDEFAIRFGTSSEKRVRLVDGLRRALLSLRAAGCETVYVDGSFVTRESNPGDFDACWEAKGIDPHRLDPVLLIFDAGRLAQKVKYGGELFPAGWPADATGHTFLEFFQVDKASGNAKGIVALHLQGMTL